MSDLVTLSFDFMTADDEVQLILFQETLCDIRPELTTHSSLTDGSAILQDRSERQGDQDKFILNPNQKWTKGISDTNR